MRYFLLNFPTIENSLETPKLGPEALRGNLSEKNIFEAVDQVIDTSGSVSASCFDWRKRIGRLREL